MTTARRLPKLVLMAAMLALALFVIPGLASGGKSKLVDKDTGKKTAGNKSPVAVAFGTVRNPGKLKVTISTKPKRRKLEYGIKTNCSKGNEVNKQFPGPGDFKTLTGRSKIKRVAGYAMKDPDVCRIEASGKLRNDVGKKITVKIKHKPTD